MQSHQDWPMDWVTREREGLRRHPEQPEDGVDIKMGNATGRAGW